MSGYATRVIALSREQAQRFHSSDPYVVISLTDALADQPHIPPRPELRDRLALHFDDVYPEQCIDANGSRIFTEMTAEDARLIAEFVRRWWNKVATIVVHCHAGLSRSTGVAAAIRTQYGLDERDLFEVPRSPNRHCLTLVTEALKQA